MTEISYYMIKTLKVTVIKIVGKVIAHLLLKIEK